MAFYQPLDVARNEVRMLKIVDPVDGQYPDLVHCELETVSLDAFTPEFKRFCEKQDISSLGFHYEITKAWLIECSSAIRTRRKNVGDVQSVIKLPLWRVMEDGENSNQLDFLKDTIASITSDSSRCPLRPNTNPSIPRDGSLYSRHIPEEDAHFPYIPRFEWGDFEAISYCWESDKLERRMILNKTLIDIPKKNLEALLQRLKGIPEMKAGMKFWVDALCINQCNLDEKNHQVKLMKDIYTKAFAVIIWLGDAADDSDNVVDFISTSNLWALGDKMAWEKWWRRHFEGDLPHFGVIVSKAPWKDLLQFFFPQLLAEAVDHSRIGFES